MAFFQRRTPGDRNAPAGNRRHPRISNEEDLLPSSLRSPSLRLYDEQIAAQLNSEIEHAHGPADRFLKFHPMEAERFKDMMSKNENDLIGYPHLQSRGEADSVSEINRRLFFEKHFNRHSPNRMQPVEDDLYNSENALFYRRSQIDGPSSRYSPSPVDCKINESHPEKQLLVHYPPLRRHSRFMHEMNRSPSEHEKREMLSGDQGFRHHLDEEHSLRASRKMHGPYPPDILDEESQNFPDSEIFRLASSSSPPFSRRSPDIPIRFHGHSPPREHVRTRSPPRSSNREYSPIVLDEDYIPSERRRFHSPSPPRRYSLSPIDDLHYRSLHHKRYASLREEYKRQHRGRSPDPYLFSRHYGKRSPSSSSGSSERIRYSPIRKRRKASPSSHKRLNVPPEHSVLQDDILNKSVDAKSKRYSSLKGSNEKSSSSFKKDAESENLVPPGTEGTLLPIGGRNFPEGDRERIHRRMRPSLPRSRRSRERHRMGIPGRRRSHSSLSDSDFFSDSTSGHSSSRRRRRRSTLEMHIKKRIKSPMRTKNAVVPYDNRGSKREIHSGHPSGDVQISLRYKAVGSTKAESSSGTSATQSFQDIVQQFMSTPQNSASTSSASYNPYGMPNPYAAYGPEYAAYMQQHPGAYLSPEQAAYYQSAQYNPYYAAYYGYPYGQPMHNMYAQTMPPYPPGYPEYQVHQVPAVKQPGKAPNIDSGEVVLGNRPEKKIKGTTFPIHFNRKKSSLVNIDLVKISRERDTIALVTVPSEAELAARAAEQTENKSEAQTSAVGPESSSEEQMKSKSDLVSSESAIGLESSSEEQMKSKSDLVSSESAIGAESSSAEMESKSVCIPMELTAGSESSSVQTERKNDVLSSAEGLLGDSAIGSEAVDLQTENQPETLQSESLAEPESSSAETTNQDESLQLKPDSKLEQLDNQEECQPESLNLDSKPENAFEQIESDEQLQNQPESLQIVNNLENTSLQIDTDTQPESVTEMESLSTQINNNLESSTTEEKLQSSEVNNQSVQLEIAENPESSIPQADIPTDSLQMKSDTSVSTEIDSRSNSPHAESESSSAQVISHPDSLQLEQAKKPPQIDNNSDPSPLESCTEAKSSSLQVDIQINPIPLESKTESSV